MNKRLRKRAGTDVARRASRKTTPVFARDPLSLDRSTIRKNVRTALMVGTALSAGLLTAMIVDSQPANAAVNCIPSATLTNTNSPTGIWCATDQDLTVVTSGTTLLGGDGAGPFHDDSGIQIQTYNNSPTGIDVVVTAGGAGIGTGPYVGQVSGNGIEVQIRDYVSPTGAATINISNAASDPIGVSGNPVGLRGIYGYTYVKPTVVIAGGNYTVGNASGTVNLTNAGAIFSSSDGIVGNARTIDSAGSTIATSGTGGTAVAAVTITNNTGGVITSGGMGLYGHSRAYANGAGTKAYGGHATATTTITNADSIQSSTDGIRGNSRGYANGFGSGNAGGIGSGGTAVAGLTITNNTGGTISSVGASGIDGYVLVEATGGDLHTPSGFGSAYKATGGTATGNVNIGNAGTITSQSDGIYGHVKAFAGGYGSYVAPSGALPGGSATGGKAIAGVSISNSGSIKSTSADGINGYARAKANAFGWAATAGVAISTTTITNTTAGSIVSGGIGIYGASVAFANGNSKGAKGVAQGGTATATTVITNAANLTASGGANTILGSARATADGGSADTASTVRGGTAIAGTTISNTGTLTTGRDGLRGQAYADASGIGSYTAGSTATGGLAQASVLINNTGGSITATNGIDGISSFTRARANGYGYVAFGGVASATTTVNNTAPISSYSVGIRGTAGARADSYGSSAAKGAATGGTATATVTIVSQGSSINVSGTHYPGVGYEGINGTAYTTAEAGSSGNRAYTAKAGTATATTAISNTASIVSTGDGVRGYATTTADAYGSTTGPKGKATGGTGIATVNISNAGSIVASVPGADGIIGYAKAGPNGNGYSAYGGVGIATTSIFNSKAVFAANDGIVGIAFAQSEGFGSNAKSATGPGGKGYGGTALATVTITNSGDIADKHIPAPVCGDCQAGSGLDGFTFAFADGFGFTAKGGTATATTTLTNSGNITSYYDDGINGIAIATALGVAPIGTKGSSGTGGTAIAGTTITNSGAIAAGYYTKFGGSGIIGFSGAAATASGYTATGGTATATTLISNTGAINAYGPSLLLGDGIDGIALADASAVSSFALGAFNPTAKATAGKATATVTITNTAAAPINAYFGNGIFGLSTAIASGVGFHAYGGVATANTTINNAATIKSDAGIGGFAAAIAIGIGSPNPEPGIGKGGTASATVAISNSGLINATNGYGGGYGIIGGSYAI
ncbi:MAG: beta strand repeat-containing protein, partial [Pseudolabrys sp.]